MKHSKERTIFLISIIKLLLKIYVHIKLFFFYESYLKALFSEKKFVKYISIKEKLKNIEKVKI